MAKRSLSRPVEFPPIESFEGLGFLDFITVEDAKESAASAGGGAALSFLYSLAVDKVRLTDKTTGEKRPVFRSPLKRLGLALALGVASGAAAWRMGQRDVAKGALGGAGAIVGAEMYAKLLNKKAAFDVEGLGEADPESALSGLGMQPEEEELLEGGPATDVEEQRSLSSGGVEDVEVEDSTMEGIGSWIGA